MSPHVKCFFIGAVVAFIAANAWSDEWVSQQGIRAIIIALVLLLAAGLWMANENKGE